MDTPVYKAELEHAKGATEAVFYDNPMVYARLTGSDPFFRVVEEAWNSRPIGRDDPHSHLAELPGVENSQLNTTEQRLFLSRFLMAAATALRYLEHGRKVECASLEHHASILKTH